MEETDDTQIQEAPEEVALDVYSGLHHQWEAIEKFGEHIAKSGMCGADKREQGTIIAFTCMAEKITPMQFSRTYDLILGKPTKKAATMLAEFRTNYGGDFEWIETGDDKKKATIQLTYKGRELAPVSFHIEDADHLKKKDNWVQNTGEMLRARCITKALRMHVPEIAAGIYDPYEAMASSTAVGAAISDLVAKTSMPEESQTDYVGVLKQNLENCSEAIRDVALGKILDRFKVAEVESLSQGQAKKVVDAWDAFMDQIAKETGANPK